MKKVKIISEIIIAILIIVVVNVNLIRIFYTKLPCNIIRVYNTSDNYQAASYRYKSQYFYVSHKMINSYEEFMSFIKGWQNEGGYTIDYYGFIDSPEDFFNNNSLIAIDLDDWCDIKANYNRVTNTANIEINIGQRGYVPSEQIFIIKVPKQIKHINKIYNSKIDSNFIEFAVILPIINLLILIGCAIYVIEKKK